jgi:hypothetical protein
MIRAPSAGGHNWGTAFGEFVEALGTLRANTHPTSDTAWGRVAFERSSLQPQTDGGQ